MNSLNLYGPTIFFAIVFLVVDYLFPGLEISQDQNLLFILIYIVGAGHVYTTFLETLFDKEEIKNQKTYLWIIIAFILCYLILKWTPWAFFYFLFYFNIYHNMRQGLGISFILQGNQKIPTKHLKSIYYFFTLVPFFLFHFRERQESIFNKEILLHWPLAQYFPPHLSISLVKWGVGLYLIGLFIGVIFLIAKKIPDPKPFLFFGSLYGLAFLGPQNDTYSYGLIILSHGIPYFFLMNERIKSHHSLSNIRKFSFLALIGFVVFGALIDYNQDSLRALTTGDIWVEALLFTPLIAHFLIDAQIWKKNHPRNPYSH